MTDGHIDITGIDKAELLVALYHGTHPLGMGVLHDNPEFGIDDAKAALASEPSGRLDYVSGRPIKVNISGNSFDPALYDRDAGEGAAQRIVDMLNKPVKKGAAQGK